MIRAKSTAAIHMEWTIEMELGIEVIDEQHKKLVDYINELGEQSCLDTENILRLLDALVEYTRTHFKKEEQLQEDAKFIGIAAHKSNHEIFENQINIFRRRAERGEHICAQLVEMLKTWLCMHIMIEDKRYVDCVKKHMSSGIASLTRTKLQIVPPPKAISTE